MEEEKNWHVWGSISEPSPIDLFWKFYLDMYNNRFINIAL